MNTVTNNATIEVAHNYGKIIIKLDQLLSKQEQSRNKLTYALELSSTQLNKYVDNAVMRVNMTFLARVCCVFDCPVSDVLEYLPPDEVCVTAPEVYEQVEQKFFRYQEPGQIVIKLGELIALKGIKKTKLSHLAECSIAQINNYINNTVSRLDLDLLARLCGALHCTIDDILEYQSPQQELG